MVLVVFVGLQLVGLVGLMGLTVWWAGFGFGLRGWVYSLCVFCIKRAPRAVGVETGDCCSDGGPTVRNVRCEKVSDDTSCCSFHWVIVRKCERSMDILFMRSVFVLSLVVFVCILNQVFV